MSDWEDARRYALAAIKDQGRTRRIGRPGVDQIAADWLHDHRAEVIPPVLPALPAAQTAVEMDEIGPCPVTMTGIAEIIAASIRMDAEGNVWSMLGRTGEPVHFEMDRPGFDNSALLFPEGIAFPLSSELTFRYEMATTDVAPARRDILGRIDAALEDWEHEAMRWRPGCGGVIT